MLTMWDMYWITRLDSINFICAAIIILGCMAACFAWIPAMDDWDSDIGDKVKKVYKIIIISVVCASVIVTFTPSTKEVVAIYMIPKIANNEQVKKLPDNAMKLLNGKLEEWINDIDKRSKDKK